MKKRGRWVNVHAVAWAIDADVNSPAERAVLLSYAVHARKNDGVSFLSLARLAAETKLDRRTITAAVKKLETLGHIADTKGRAGQTGRIRKYRLNVCGNAPIEYGHERTHSVESIGTNLSANEYKNAEAIGTETSIRRTDSKKEEKNTELAALFEEANVKGATNPVLQELAGRFSVSQIRESIRIARRNKAAPTPIPVNYLRPILESLPKSNGSARIIADVMSSGIERGAAVGVYAKVGEPMDAFMRRVVAAERR